VRVKYVNSLIELVGHTPLLRLSRATDGAKPLVLAKVEYLNPGGSVKDRIALKMVEAAEREGKIKPGGTIVEPTSGNTGVGLAMVAQAKGYACVFVCPDKVSEDKRNVLTAYGAQVVVCPTAVEPEHPNSYYSVSDRLVREIEGAWKPDQYSNPNNPISHYETRSRDLGADRGQDQPLRRRGRHRGHHQRGGPLLERGLGGPGQDHRRGPLRFGVLRRDWAALFGRGCG
jgi:cystathionine beta-synthase